MATKKENSDVTPAGPSSSMMNVVSLSPFAYSGLQEIADIQSSNDRMATLLEAVRASEMEKARLNAIVQSSKEISDREKCNIKQLYEEQLLQARKSFDELSLEKEKLVIDVERLWHEKAALKEQNGLSNSFMTKFHETMNRYNESVNDRKKSLAKAKNLKIEVTKLREQLEQHRIKLGNETDSRIKLESTIAALREELQLKDQVHVEELNNSSVTLNVSCDLANQIKFTDELKQLRNQCEDKIRSNRREIESTLLMKMGNEQDSLRRENTSLKVALASMFDRINANNVRIGDLERVNSSLNARLGELQSSLDAQVALIIEGEAEINQLRQQLALQFENYQDLIDMKISSSVERAAYDRLLSGGEHLLNIEPSSKRIRNEFDIVSDYAVESFSSGSIEISSAYAAETFIKLLNKGEMDVSLGGWKLIRQAGGNETVHMFDDSDKINGGGDLTVWSADDSESQSASSFGDISLNSQNWTFGDEMKTTLVNGDGKLEASVQRTRKHRSSRYQRIRQQVADANNKCILM